MTGFEDLTADQRAVVELVLRSGRSYDQIATILKIDRAAVRARALAGLDALAPEWSAHLPEARRALLTDYLLGQLPSRLAEQVRERLEREDAERAWAEAVAAELGPIAAGPLPEIPPAFGDAEAGPAPVAAEPAGPALSRQAPPPHGVITRGERRSSRRGGAVLLALGAVIVIAVIVVVLAVVLSSGGSSSNKSTSTGSAAVSVPTTTTATTTPTAPGNASSKALAVTILAPASSGSKTKGAAEIISEKGALWLFLVGVNLQPNSHNLYAVWLTNGPTDSQLIGFQTVTSSGRLAAFTRLTSTKSTYSRFKRMLVTLETKTNPKTPGTVVLSGPFNLK